MTVISSSALTMLSCWTDFPVLLAISRPFMAFMWKSFTHLFIRLFTILLLIRSLFPMVDFASDARSYFSVFCMSLTFVLNARCAGYPFIASVKMVWGLVNISPWPAGMSEGGTVQKRGVFSHASCTRLLPALLLRRSGPGRRGGSGIFSTGRLWSFLLR